MQIAMANTGERRRSRSFVLIADRTTRKTASVCSKTTASTVRVCETQAERQNPDRSRSGFSLGNLALLRLEIGDQVVARTDDYIHRRRLVKIVIHIDSDRLAGAAKA